MHKYTKKMQKRIDLSVILKYCSKNILMEADMSDLNALMEKYKEVQALKLNLNIQRGQPGDDNFDISNGLLDSLSLNEVVTPSGVALRNYPGGPSGLAEAKKLFSEVIGVTAEETIVGNNSSLKMLVNTLMWALIRGLKDSEKPWVQLSKPKMIVTLPGYDRHFTLLDALGFEMVPVQMTGDGPDVDEIEKLASNNKEIKGLIFVPTYSNPTGETISDKKIKQLASMKTAAADFTIFADDAYAVHHLTDSPKKPLNLLRECEKAGNPDRVYIMGSTSKITFAGAGIGFMGTSKQILNTY